MNNIKFIVIFIICLIGGNTALSESLSSIYFAADAPPSNNIPPEAPLCYKFEVQSIDEQLDKLKKKYSGLYDYKIEKYDDGSKALFAKRNDSDGKVIEYFYSTSPVLCSNYQKHKFDYESNKDIDQKYKHDYAKYKIAADTVRKIDKPELEKNGDKQTFIKENGNFAAAGNIIFYFNSIQTGDYEIIRSITQNMLDNGIQPKSVIFVNNYGGNLGEALKIGNFIRQNAMNTAASMECASACLYAFAGGIFRSGYNNVKFGLHQFAFSDGDKGTIAEGQSILSLLFNYLESMGVNPKIVAWQSEVHADQIRWISQYEASGLKLVNRIFENYEMDIPNFQ